MKLRHLVHKPQIRLQLFRIEYGSTDNFISENLCSLTFWVQKN